MEIEGEDNKEKRHHPVHSTSISSDTPIIKLHHLNHLQNVAQIKKKSSDSSLSLNSLQNSMVKTTPSNSDKEYKKTQHSYSMESDMSGKVTQNSDLFEKLNSEGMQAPPLLNPYRMSYKQDSESTNKTVSSHDSIQSRQSTSPVLKQPMIEPQLSIVQEENEIAMIVEASGQSSSSQSGSIINRVVLQQIPSDLKCRCHKSKCIQLYCECFSRGVLCKDSCECRLCRNSLQYKERLEKAKNTALEKNPEAFTTKLQRLQKEDGQTLGTKRGCNCKKTLCYKKYCECFLAGVRCSRICRCDNCLNGGDNAFKN